jgi:hypothetical protein
MNFKNLVLIASVAAFAGLYSCKTEDKKEGSENPPAVSNNDLNNAKSLDIIFPLRDTTIMVDSGNAGGGQVQEFNADSASLRHMPAAEDNTDWYKITADGDTGVAFTIKPKDAASELDFVLFRASSADVSADLAAGKLNALRSNFNTASGDGSTGLACNTSLTFHGSDGNSMSRAFTLRKGQVYYLVVNSPAGRINGYEMSFHACAPGEGGLSDFEGNSANPEEDPAGGSAAGSGTGSGGEGTDGTSSEQGSAGSTTGKAGAGKSGSGQGAAGSAGGSSGKAGAGKSGSGQGAEGSAGASSGKAGAGK